LPIWQLLSKILDVSPKRTQPTITRAIGSRPPRRLPREVRYEQLIATAMPIVAEQGFASFSLDEVAERADVTRKLLYHYFPRGRSDVVLAVAERAGRQLTDDWVVDESIPLPKRLTTNMSRMIEHAKEPTDAWRIYHLARAATEPELKEMVDRFVEVVVTSVSLNQLGTSDPPQLARLAIRGYLAFFDSVLDDARTTAAPLERITPMLAETLVATVNAGVAASR
jgi:AcrR family transcriptional regulator